MVFALNGYGARSGHGSAADHAARRQQFFDHDMPVDEAAVRSCRPGAVDRVAGNAECIRAGPEKLALADRSKVLSSSHSDDRQLCLQSGDATSSCRAARQSVLLEPWPRHAQGRRLDHSTASAQLQDARSELSRAAVSWDLAQRRARPTEPVEASSQRNERPRFASGSISTTRSSPMMMCFSRLRASGALSVRISRAQAGNPRHHPVAAGRRTVVAKVAGSGLRQRA